MTSRKAEVYNAVGVLVLTAVLSIISLWWIGVLESGRWVNSSRSRVLISSGDFDTFRREINVLSERPLVVAFYSESCLHCKRMRKPFLRCSVEHVDMNFVAVNAEQSAGVAEVFKIKFVPTVLYIPDRQSLSEYHVYEGGANFHSLSRFLKTHS